MSDGAVDVARAGNHAVVTLCRPERLNALTPAMLQDLDDVLPELDADPAVRAIVLTGAGRGFCAGLDLDVATRLDQLDVVTFYARQEAISATLTRPWRMSTPVIAAVNGPASGGGLALALAADIRIATPHARFSAPFVRIGLTGCDVGVSWLLPRVVGLGHASEMLLTGRVVDADEAAMTGLVNRVVPADDLLNEAARTAAAIAGSSPFGVLLTKQGLRVASSAVDLDVAAAIENRQQVLAARGPDYRTAASAFLRSRRSCRSDAPASDAEGSAP